MVWDTISLKRLLFNVVEWGGRARVRRFAGVVREGYGIASRNLKHVMHLIEERMGLPGLVDGTLNVKIAEEYIVEADRTISREEYGQPGPVIPFALRSSALRASNCE